MNCNETLVWVKLYNIHMIANYVSVTMDMSEVIFWSLFNEMTLSTWFNNYHITEAAW